MEAVPVTTTLAIPQARRRGLRVAYYSPKFSEREGVYGSAWHADRKSSELFGPGFPSDATGDGPRAATPLFRSDIEQRGEQQERPLFLESRPLQPGYESAAGRMTATSTTSLVSSTCVSPSKASRNRVTKSRAHQPLGSPWNQRMMALAVRQKKACPHSSTKAGPSSQFDKSRSVNCRLLLLRSKKVGIGSHSRTTAGRDK